MVLARLLIIRTRESRADAREGLRELGSHGRDGGDDDDRDERRDQTILDGRRAGLVWKKDARILPEAASFEVSDFIWRSFATGHI
jgi:hypothetical protein